MTNACATRYICVPENAADREGGGCSQAWLNMGSNSCSVTVVAVTGERRTVDVRRFFTGHHTCRAGCGGRWVDVPDFATDPGEIIVTFALPDGGSVNDADVATCEPSADGSATCWGDDSAGPSTPPAGI
jgi:hypothetical protein